MEIALFVAICVLTVATGVSGLITLTFPSTFSFAEDVSTTAYPIPLTATSSTSSNRVWTLMYSVPLNGAFDLYCPFQDGSICYFGYNVTKNGGTPMFDFQTNDYYYVYIFVNDTTSSAIGILNVTITQSIKAPTIGAGTGGTVSVAEGSPAFTYLSTISATDPQGYLPLKYLVSKVTPQQSSYFYVSSSGVLTTSGVAQLNHTATPVWVVYVDVANSGTPARTSTYSLTVSITTIGHAPTVTNLPAVIYMPEDTTAGSLIYTIRMSDADGDTVWKITFASNPITGNQKFTIDSTGNVYTTSSPFNYKTEANYYLKVYVVDSGVIPAATVTATLSIVVTSALSSSTSSTKTTTTTTTPTPNTATGACVGFCANSLNSATSSSVTTTSAWIIPVAVVGALLGAGAIATVLYCVLKPPSEVSSTFENLQTTQNQSGRFSSRSPPPAYAPRHSEVHIVRDPNSVYK